MEISVVEPKDLDFDEHARLQSTAFKQVLKGTGEEATQTPEFFRWKFNGPLAPSKIAVIRENGKMVASNSMSAMDLVWNGKKIRGWQSGDTATLPEARGKGYFVKCIQSLGDTLKSDEIFFGFPNGTSIGGLKKAGWVERYIMPAWARVLPPLSKKVDSMEKILQFGPEHEALLKNHSMGHDPLIEKTSAYMNWRYLQQPVAGYQAYAYKKSQSIEGIIVLRKVDGFNRQMAVIMDVIASDSVVEDKLYRFAGVWAAENKLWPTITLSTGLDFPKALKNLYFPIPAKLMPKYQILLGKTTGPVAQEFFDRKWELNLGDWDGY